jgi:hypothetical protein
MKRKRFAMAIRTTLEAVKHFSQPPVLNTKQLPFDVRGNQPPKMRAAQNDVGFGEPIEPRTEEGSALEGFQNYSGEGRLPEFDWGRHSNPEQIPSENGPGTAIPAETSTLPEAGEAESVAGEALALI